MFLSHFSNTPLNVVLEMDAEDLEFWVKEAVSLHKHMNRDPEK